ncbi:unnamed protein product, partial [Staurois parvus]
CCQSVPPISASQCHLSVPSVPPNSASQCRLSVLYISAAFQCPSVMPVNAISVPPTSSFLISAISSTHLSVSISASYQCPSLQPH